MYIDLNRVDNELHRSADVCIIGSGPAGIAVALPLLKQGFQICMLESGGLSSDSDVQDLANGNVVGRADLDLRTERNRQFGGSTNSWAGACAPMSPSDFDARPWLGIKGWPYSFQELLPFYTKAQSMFEIGPFAYSPNEWSGSGEPFLLSDSECLETRIWQLSPRTNFGRIYRERFSRDSNIDVVLNATVTALRSGDCGRSVTGVEARSLAGRTAKVSARAYVLACGGIDNPRLLLLSRDHAPHGLGNDHDVVGRYFMAHPHVGAASVRFSGSMMWTRAYKDRLRGTVWTRARIGMLKEAQARHRVLNPIASFINRFVTDELSHAQSVGYVALKRIFLETARGRVPSRLPGEMAKIACDVPGLCSGLWHHLRNRTGALYVMGEQAPNCESRVTLSTSRDALGMERPQLSWRLSPIDKVSIRALVAMVDAELQRKERGRAVPDEWLLADDISWPARVTGGFHHMGTTRMGLDPKDSVVDTNARVHCVHNLFVAGSSIFPTVGCANPTLTIVATALKLSEHLAHYLIARSGSEIISDRLSIDGPRIPSVPPIPISAAHSTAPSLPR